MTIKENGYKKGLWTEEEDKILLEYIRVHGKRQWNRIPRVTGLKRGGKSCRLRWLNYLSPNVKHGNFSEEEEDLIIRLHKLLGNRWSLIAGRVPGRTDNQVKNHWNTHLCKKLGIQKQAKKVGVTSKSKPQEVEGTQNLPVSLKNEPLAPEYHQKREEVQGQGSRLNDYEICSETHWPEIEMQFDHSFLYADDNHFLDCPDLMRYFDGF